MFCSLLPHVLADGYPSYAARYLQQLLLNPPPFYIADNMRSLLHLLMTKGVNTNESSGSSVPLCPPLSIGKVVSLLSAGQANAATFREIAANVQAVSSFLRSGSGMLPHLLVMTSYDSGISTSQALLLGQLERVYALIERTVALDETMLDRKDVPNRDPHFRIPDDFFHRNEVEFRGSIAIGE